MSVTAGVSDAVIAIRDKLRGKIGQTKVKRYWPGKAPEWADDVEEDEDIRASKLAALEKAFPTHDDADVLQKDDRRLRRLAESRIESKEEVRADHRRIRQAEIISTIEEEDNKQEGLELEEEDDDAIEERRRRIREKLLQRDQEEAALLPVEEEDEAEEEEEESEYETDSEEEQLGIAMVKPVFIPKSQRETIAERERLEEEERRLEELVKKRLEERRVETRQIVVEGIRKDQEIQKNLEAEADIADVDTDDDMNEAEEYEAWKTREIARIKREREDREARLKEKEEIERVRNMTEEERREWERKDPKQLPVAKQKWRFMQKYNHKGVPSSSQVPMTMQQQRVQMISLGVISLPLLEKIRWTNPFCPRSCKSSTFDAVEELNGLILLTRIQLIGMPRKYTFHHSVKYQPFFGVTTE